MKGQSPPCSEYLFLSKVVTCNAPNRVHCPAHFSTVHCHWPAMHTLGEWRVKINKSSWVNIKRAKAEINEGGMGETDTNKYLTSPGVAFLLYCVPRLVGASAVETGTIVSFQTGALVKVEAWRTLTASNTLLPALAHGCSGPDCLRWRAARGAGGHTVWKHLTSGADTTWEQIKKKGQNKDNLCFCKSQPVNLYSVYAQMWKRFYLFPFAIWKL